MKTTDKVFTQLQRGTTVSLASINSNGYPRPVPMAIISVDGKKNIWFATSTKSEKVKAYRENPYAGLSFHNNEMSASLTGKAYVIEDKKLKREMWSEALSLYFPDGADSSDYCLLKFVPELLRAVMIKDIYKYEVKTIVLLT